jgi:hypothetical protein
MCCDDRLNQQPIRDNGRGFQIAPERTFVAGTANRLDRAHLSRSQLMAGMTGGARLQTGKFQTHKGEKRTPA